MTRRDSGATFVETALIIPTFIGVIFIFLWVATVLNAKATLSTALGHSLRLALTRSNPMALGRPLYNLDLSSAAMQSVLCHGVDATACFHRYNKCYVQQLFTKNADDFDSPNLSDIPPKYTYLLIYINETMRQSVGNSIKFPCSPNNSEEWCPGYGTFPDTDPSADSSGCLMCRLVSAMRVPPSVPPSDRRIDLSRDEDEPNAYKEEQNILSLYGSMGVECAYEIDSSLVRPAQRLLKWTGVGGFVISATQVLKSDNLAPPNSIR